MGQQLIALDPSGSDVYAQAERLRALGPVTRVLIPEGPEAWSINDHALLKKLLTDPRISKDPRKHWPAWQRGEYQTSWLATWVGVNNMFTAYGEDHRRLRKLIAPAFTARRTEAIQPSVERITTALIEELAAVPVGEATDLRAGFAHPLPMRVICELFGIPSDDTRTDLARNADVIMTSVDPEEAGMAFMAVQELLRGLVTLKREQPAEDLTSLLVASRDEEGHKMSEQELIDTLMLVLIAGHETTVNLIGNAVHNLLTHPEQLKQVRSGQASWNDVIEETLRWSPSIANLPLRFAVEDIEIEGGPTIRKGEAILPALAATGRDPVQHGATAGEFTLTRPNVEHLSFGHGVHHCLGAPLARMEARIALPALFDRFPDLQLAVPEDELVPSAGFITGGLASMPIRLTSH